MQKKGYTMSILFLMSLCLLLPHQVSGARNSKLWDPNTNDVPGYSHVMNRTDTLGTNLALIDTPLVRVDLWEKTNVRLIVSITILNETNVFDAPLPESLKNTINSYTSGQSLSITVNTIWDLLSVAVPTIAGILRVTNMTNTHSKKLKSDEYYYLEEGLCLYSKDFTLALAKDENLALILISLPLNNKPVDTTAFKTTVDSLVTQINGIIQNCLGSAVSITSSPEAAAEPDPEPDSDVLNVLGHLSAQFGTNNYNPNAALPGYSIPIVLVCFIIIPIIVRKRIFH